MSSKRASSRIKRRNPVIPINIPTEQDIVIPIETPPVTPQDNISKQTKTPKVYINASGLLPKKKKVSSRSVEVQTEFDRRSVGLLFSDEVHYKESGSQTMPTNTQEASTQTEPIEERMLKHVALQDEEFAQAMEVALDAIQSDSPKSYLPFQLRRLEGALLTDIYIFYPFYEAIEVVERAGWFYENRKIMKTEYIPIQNPYWDEFRQYAEKFHPISAKLLESFYDKASVWVEERNGYVYAFRHGVKVVIKYPDGGVGNVRQYEPFMQIGEIEEFEGKKGEPGKFGVPLSHLNYDCPFFHRAFKDLVFPKDRGYSKWVWCNEDDGIRMLIFVEPNGQIDIKRNGRRYRLRWSFLNF